jgi:hypothetical protein
VTSFFGLSRRKFTREEIKGIAAGVAEKINKTFGEIAMTQGQWQPIETAPKENGDEFLVYDGIGVWKAWRCDGDILGYEVDGCELPVYLCPPTHWMALLVAPKEASNG